MAESTADRGMRMLAFQRMHLDGLVQTINLAQEEYGQWLDEYESQFGKQAREAYEERNV